MHVLSFNILLDYNEQDIKKQRYLARFRPLDAQQFKRIEGIVDGGKGAPARRMPQSFPALVHVAQLRPNKKQTEI
jgi:hypothetical protein